MSRFAPKAIAGSWLLMTLIVACATEPEAFEFSVLSQARDRNLDEEGAVAIAQDGVLLIDGKFFGGACDTLSGSVSTQSGLLRLEVTRSAQFTNCPSGSALYRYTATVRQLELAQYDVEVVHRRPGWGAPLDEVTVLDSTVSIR